MDEIKENGDKAWVWVVTYLYKELDNPLTDGETKAWVFNRKEKAAAWMAKDYENALSEFQDEETAVHDIIGNYLIQSGAEIQLGDKDTEEVATIHKWELLFTTLDNGI